jgi:tRNA nucleotidyltransferase (CCA-adding enzyme)
MRCYRVGGAVRDRLLGRPVQDHDWVVVGATAAEMLALGYRPVGKEFPVFLHPETHEEYALARTERKTAPGYKGFVFHAAPEVTLEEDLARRDLTINAIAEDADGGLIDPHDGQRDLAAGVLRHVSPAFVEDPLRILRVARFAARYAFAVAPETMALMAEIVAADELAALTPERVWQELERALGEPFPGRFLLTLRQCGALAALFPEIDRLFGIPQRPEYHPEIDTGVHLLMALEQAVTLGDTEVRFAVLLHDLGKGTTPADILPAHWGHEGRGVHLVEAFCARFRVPNSYRELARLVTEHHLLCHRALEMRPNKVLALLKYLDAFRRPERAAKFVAACEADARGRLGRENTPYPSGAYLLAAAHAARGIDTRTLPAGLSGPEMGAAVDDLRRAAIRRLAWTPALAAADADDEGEGESGGAP